MACPVDLSALYHHEEPVVVVEHLYALVNVVRQAPLALLAVIAVGHRVAVCESFSNKNGLAVLCGELFRLGVSGYYIVACFLC